MIISLEQLSSFSTSAQPLIQWLKDNCHPHCKAIVDSERAELVEGIAGHVVEPKRLEKTSLGYAEMWEDKL
jgi:hypothetical protein